MGEEMPNNWMYYKRN